MQRMRALLILMGTLICVAKDAGTRHQALNAKQQNSLRAKHIVQHQQALTQAIDLNAHHQQIQSIDLNKRHAAQKIDPKQSAGKKCSRNHIYAGLLAIFLLPVGAHRWYVLSLSLSLFIYIYINKHTHIFSYIHMYIHKHIYIYIYILYIYIYTYIYDIYIHIYIYIYVYR